MSDAEKAIPERDATPDEAFDMGSVQGYDEGYAAGRASRDAEVAAYRKGFDGSEMLRQAAEAEVAALHAFIEKIAEASEYTERKHPRRNWASQDLVAIRNNVWSVLGEAPSGVLAERDANKPVEWWPRCRECGDVHEPLEEEGTDRA